MKHSSKFYQNNDCCYYPCHEGIEELNCLFCYCPLYAKANCPGTPAYKEKDGRTIKVCSNCTFPHKPEHYDLIMEQLKDMYIS